MKVVINRCYGGFGLSHAAELALIGCPHIEMMEPKKYYGGGPGWEQKFAADQARALDLFRVLVHEGKVVLDEHRGPEARACPKLVEVVERLGVAANGPHAELAIVEIPDDIQYEIDEYDGIEHIAETHRTWQ